MQISASQVEDQIFKDEGGSNHILSVRNMVIAGTVTLVMLGGGVFWYREKIFGTSSPPQVQYDDSSPAPPPFDEISMKNTEYDDQEAKANLQEINATKLDMPEPETEISFMTGETVNDKNLSDLKESKADDVNVQNTEENNDAELDTDCQKIKAVPLATIEGTETVNNDTLDLHKQVISSPADRNETEDALYSSPSDDKEADLSNIQAEDTTERLNGDAQNQEGADNIDQTQTEPFVAPAPAKTTTIGKTAKKEKGSVISNTEADSKKAKPPRHKKKVRSSFTPTNTPDLRKKMQKDLYKEAKNAELERKKALAEEQERAAATKNKKKRR